MPTLITHLPGSSTDQAQGERVLYFMLCSFHVFFVCPRLVGRWSFWPLPLRDTALANNLPTCSCSPAKDIFTSASPPDDDIATTPTIRIKWFRVRSFIPRGHALATLSRACVR